MVTRVDKKPIIYNTSLIRAWRPAIVCANKTLLSAWASRSYGYRIPTATPREILDDYEDIELGMRYAGLDEPEIDMFHDAFDEDEDEALRIARMCVNLEPNVRKAMKTASMLEDIASIQSKLVMSMNNIYYGTEGVYKLLSWCLNNHVFEKLVTPNYAMWASETASKVCVAQSMYMFIHPSGVRRITQDYKSELDSSTWQTWDMYKKIETIALRLSSRRNLLAHSYYYGINKKGFSPDTNPLEDFRIPLTGHTKCKEQVAMYLIMGLKYYIVGDSMFVLSPDDCTNLASMAQCYYRTSVYFMRGNGYNNTTKVQALGLVKDILGHCCKLIDAGQNFSHIIRSLHILAQGDFNDSFEALMGTNLGWKERSANYIKEANELDPMGTTFHKRALALANGEMDKLNVGFIYHNFVGDEMLLSDLKSKVANMASKVMPADKKEWASFIAFSKSYLLCRFMMTNKRKPRAGGDIKMLNEPWAERCVAGAFTMPPRASWGKVWIEGEFSYSNFADVWHLEAQDVSYVVKDSKGLAKGKYAADKFINSELLMAMVYGNKLDHLKGTTPAQARERICRAESCSEVVLTTAPKAENAKPSWKKRVTFAADCEFRKMQSEYDRNCRKVMSFLRGPSLGVDQCILEKQFHDIAVATGLGSAGSICSHDISGWSESMDRKRKFEFEQILTNMLTKPEMTNIRLDWDRIHATVLKQGAKEVISIDNGSFQGFDGSASSILHSLILIYCIDTARKEDIMSPTVKTNMATLIDDCIALMNDLCKESEALAFWTHLKATYKKLGFVVDDLKSIYSSIKAIYLSRRFLMGGEVPSDYKVFLKAHSSYEDPLRSSADIASDIMGGLRGAADANGDIWFIYYTAVTSILADIAHNCNTVMNIPPDAACIFALAPSSENGWAIPSLIDWATNDVTDKRCHFNAILEALAEHEIQPKSFRGPFEVYSRTTGMAVNAIKSQPWRLVSYSSIFTSPFEAVREGPLKPDMLKRNAIQDILKDVVKAEPWLSLLQWHNSTTTNKVRELLISSGCLHAPTLAALVNCMPDNYRLALVGKAIGSQSLLKSLPKPVRATLRRRVLKCARNMFEHSWAIYSMHKVPFEPGNFAVLSHVERTIMEREEFYSANGVTMTDHTFPDPVGTFTNSGSPTGSVICPSGEFLKAWDPASNDVSSAKKLVSVRSTFWPRRSNRVWEVTSEYGKGWDTVSQRIAMGLAILARANADGHETDGLLAYFVRSWNEFSNISPEDTHLIAIHGSIKRLDANPGSSTHPIIIHRNLITAFNNKIKTALDVIPIKALELTGSTSHLHDHLSHETCMLAATALQFTLFHILGISNNTQMYHIATRPDCVIPECANRMTTNCVRNDIEVEIIESDTAYGLLQSCPELVAEIAIPTMKSSWVQMINALVDGKYEEVDDMRKEALSSTVEDLIVQLETEQRSYTTAVVLAAPPADRGHIAADSRELYAIAPSNVEQRQQGDSYTLSVRTVSSKFARALHSEQPGHVNAAIAIKSAVWAKLKSRQVSALAKILYNDPDLDLSILSNCSRAEFWRSVVYEVQVGKKDLVLSEACMRGFRALGVAGLHIRASNELADVSHSVASYFGANLRAVCQVCADQISSISGRAAKNFEKPILERVITNNPGLVNSKMRKEHMQALVKYNVENLSERLKRIESSEINHRGDIRSCEYDQHARIVELRTRLYVYITTHISDSGVASVSEADHAKIISSAAHKVAERYNVDLACLPQVPLNFEGTLSYMDEVGLILAQTGENTGWDAHSGKLGSRYAYDTIMRDSAHVSKTQFAVSASEIAPKLHKKVIQTEKSTPDVGTSLQIPMPDFLADIDPLWGESLDIASITDFSFLSATPTRLNMEAWKGLYTLLYSRVYTARDVNAKLGTCLDDEFDLGSLREAHLSDFADDEIYEKFPQILGDYVGCGMVFDPDWLTRDEAEAYTTDELGKFQIGNLF